MSGRVFWDSRTQIDLDSIIDYIAIEQQSPQNADSFLDDVFEKANLYASNPLLGESREDLGPGLRVFAVHSCVVVYADVAEGIYILRVIQGSRDYKRLF